MTSNATIIEQLRLAARQRPDWAALIAPLDDPIIGLHLAVMRQPFLNYILAGQKTVESRFSQYKIAPYGQIAPGDLVFMKAGEIVGAFRAGQVVCQQTTPLVMPKIHRRYARAIRAEDDGFWQRVQDKPHVTLIDIADMMALSPTKITKKDKRGWITLRRSYSP